MLAPAPLLDATAARWLPLPYAYPGLGCPACGGSLAHSVTHRYLACVACGWQRALTPSEATDAVFAAAGWPAAWRKLQADLAARDPDPLPPVAALLWRRLSATTWAGPSRTQPDTTYTITEYASGHVHCTCPHFGKGCWHRTRGAELGLVDRTTADGLF